MMKNWEPSYWAQTENPIKRFLWALFDVFDVPCRMLIEVFTRRGFGERYFRLWVAVATFLVLMLLPLALPIMGIFFPPIRMAVAHSMSFTGFIGLFAYLVLFLIMSVRHHQAQKTGPSVYRFERTSFFPGFIHKAFYIQMKEDETVSRRIIECWLEPAPFFLLGLILAYFGQYLGFVLVFCAVNVCVNQCAAYNAYDNYVMDKIDEILVGESEAKFLDRSEDPTAPQPLANLPPDPEHRQRVIDAMRADQHRNIPMVE